MAALKQRTAPVVGDFTRRAAQLDVGGQKRRLLRGSKQVDALLTCLERAGLVTVHRASWAVDGVDGRGG